MSKQMTKEESINLLIQTIEDKENAFSIEHTEWHDSKFLWVTRPPKDSHKGKCGTPACVMGWREHLLKTVEGFSGFQIPLDITTPNWRDPTTDNNSYDLNPEYFTRTKTVACLKHWLATGEVDWQALEKSNG